MTHEEIAELLGAYALNATDLGQRREIDAHIAECQHCRAEVDAHLEMAALLAGPGADAPPGVWEKIARSIADQRAPEEAQRPSPALPTNLGPPNLGPPNLGPPNLGPPTLGPLATAGAAHRRSRPPMWAAVALVAAALVIFLGMEVGLLHSQVGSLNQKIARSGLAGAALRAEAGPHRTLTLTSTTHQVAATIVVAPSGAAYWVGSSLPDLPAAQTYQLWGLARGKPVSLGLEGPDPHAVGYFRLEKTVTEVMVTAEPSGGTPLPTTGVLVQGPVPGSFLS